jgi:hypothetical protein
MSNNCEENIKSLRNIFHIDEQVRREKAVDFAFKSLQSYWNYSDELLMAVANHFKCASEGNVFIDILDGADDMQDAWERYCEHHGDPDEKENCPFLEIEY